VERLRHFRYFPYADREADGLLHCNGNVHEQLRHAVDARAHHHGERILIEQQQQRWFAGHSDRIRTFDDGRRFFGHDQFPEARASFARADRAGRDARVQFYIAYSYYREGWGRLHSDDALDKQGLAAIDAAIALAPNGRLVADDPDLEMHSADELRAELPRGLTVEAADFNPLRVFRKRK